MPKPNLPQPFQIDKARFKDCLSAPSLRRFAVCITVWGRNSCSHLLHGITRKLSHSRTCLQRRDVVISPQEFRAIPVNTAAIRKSSRFTPRTTATLSKRQNYRYKAIDRLISDLTVKDYKSYKKNQYSKQWIGDLQD